MPAYIYPDESRDHLVTRTGNQTITGQKKFLTSAATVIGLIVQGSASQTANLQEWQLNDGTVRARVGPGGGIWTDSDLVTTATGSAQFGGANWYGASVNVTARTAANQGIVIRGAASQTANLQEWQSSAGGNFAYFGPGGRLSITTGGSFAENLNSRVGIETFSATERGLVIRGATAQTANLQEFQNSAGTSLLRFTAKGNIDIVTNQSSTGTGIVDGSTHNSLNIYQATDGGGYGHGFFSIGYNTSGRSIQFGTQSGPTYSSSTFIPTIIINDNGTTNFKALAGQAGNIANFQNSAGSTLFAVQANGRPDFRGGSDTLAVGSYAGRIYIYVNGVGYNIPYYNG